ncbi:metal-dependent hydrolase [Vibrio aphrogenes]|uniref:metal-dependent hydrolase n=1 Tax=Vibrio aphrogenes TaxID=1891186 RepID=UPI000B34D359|nr:metal-dependent hydrolase [Vibrio aphrogenes]
MDPVSQGVLGATAALLVSNKSHRVHAAKVGCVAGLAPDLDVLIKSSSDPLLALEFHRQFTHSLFFIPIGGLIVAFLLWAVVYRQVPFKQTLLFATIGYATHGLLDAFTTYGTQLLWPLSNQRIAWDMIGIIDPLVTVPLLLAVILTCRTKAKKWIVIGSLFFVAYMSFGALQHHRALQAVQLMASAHTTPIQRVKAMPTIGNLLVWRTLYQAGDQYYVNALRISLFGEIKMYPGQSIAVLNQQKAFPTLDKHSVQQQDIQRFRWFSDGWLVSSPSTPNAIADLRYSPQVNGTTPLWEIVITPHQSEQHISYQSHTQENQRQLLPWQILTDH